MPLLHRYIPGPAHLPRKMDYRTTASIVFIRTAPVAASFHYNYSFADNDPGAGSNYYRLQQQDIDGKFSYSRTIRIDFSAGNKLHVYPNPASKFIIISGLSTGSVVQLYSVEGKKLKDWRSSSSILEIDTKSMPKGVFFLRVVDHASKSQTLPVIIK
jgi:hypothetical protein